MRSPRDPNLYRPTSQLSTRDQLNQAAARRWTAEMRIPLSIARKVWERVYILEVLDTSGVLREGSTGLGFGVGVDAMIPAMVNRGVKLVATDLGGDDRLGWGNGLELDPRGIAGAERMSAAVEQRDVDMTAIPDDLRDFDFVYSCGSLEHIGGADNGLQFVEDAMRCLRPGGVAVHTTEFDASTGVDPIDSPELSLYQIDQIEGLVERLTRSGHHVMPLNLRQGSRSEDLHVADKPYPPPNLKSSIRGRAAMSIGLFIIAGPTSRVDRAAWPAPRLIADVGSDLARAVRRRLPPVLAR